MKVPRQALALGLGSMFNHHRIPNIAWERSLSTESIRYFTLREVSADEELCISYGPKLWFEDVDKPNTEEEEKENDVLLMEKDVFD
jgi:SET domain-containing protein